MNGILLFIIAPACLIAGEAMEKSHGIITRLTKLTETSLIIHWCTLEHGLIKTVAKGARRPKSAFAGKLDLFFSAEINWAPSRKSELHALREVSVRDFRQNLRKSYRDTMLAAYFCDLLEFVAEKNHPVPELYDLLDRGLGYLAEQGGDKRGMLHYEHELARLSGVAHERANAALALTQAFGGLPRSRQATLDAMA